MILRPIAILLMAALMSSPLAAKDSETISRSLADPARSAADRERDSREQPAEVLALAGFGEGMAIADVFGGGGYYSEILSRVVGSQGEVLLINNPPYLAYVKEDLQVRLANNRLPNVQAPVVANEALQLGNKRLDGVIMVMALHDIYYADPANNWTAIDTRQFIGQIVDSLKPGAVFLVIDHAAKTGTGSTDAQRLHRIEEDFVKSQLTASGLEFAGSIDTLRNADDHHHYNVFDPAIRGRTDRFVHLYRKPATP